MTVSTLLEIEACPRRWSLASAAYPDLWKRRGYPPKLHLPGLTGTVVHLAVEEATKALIHAGCTSSQSTEAVGVMKKLGGYTGLLNSCIDRVLARHAENPRTGHRLDIAMRMLRSRVAEMRIQVQNFLRRVHLKGAAKLVSRERLPFHAGRLALGPGVYPEVEVYAPKINWRGKIDLLTISETSCEIVDFKTGAPNEKHAFQLRVYALLWHRDAELNPMGLMANRLTISYESGDVEIESPSLAELDSIEDDLVRHGRTARASVSVASPEPRPTPDICRHCWVRHMCDAYWQHPLSQRVATHPLTMDFELLISARHGPTSWDGVITASPADITDKKVVLRCGTPSPNFAVGDRLRVLDSYVTLPGDETEPVVATLGTLTEVFIVSGDSR
jgi:hypothetical protein